MQALFLVLSVCFTGELSNFSFSSTGRTFAYVLHHVFAHAIKKRIATPSTISCPLWHSAGTDHGETTVLQKWLLILFFKIYSFDHAHSKKSVLNLCMLSQQISSSTISLRQKCRCWFPKATAIYFIKKIQHIWGYVCFNKSVMHSINCCIFARFTLVTFNHGSATVASDVIYNSKVILCEYNIKK